MNRRQISYLSLREKSPRNREQMRRHFNVQVRHSRDLKTSSSIYCLKQHLEIIHDSEVKYGIAD